MTTKFTAYDKITGQVLFAGTAQDTAALESDTVGVLTLDIFENGYIVDGIHHDLPPQPSPNHIFDYTTKQWVDPRTLQDFKDAQWKLIKQARTAAEHGGFTWDGSVFDSDAISQARITGAVQLAQIVSGFTIDWTLQNNTARTLNAADMVAVGMTLGVYVGAQFAKGQALRAQIDAAMTKEEVEAIVW